MKKLLVILTLVIVSIGCEEDETSNSTTKFEYVERDPITDTIFELTADIETGPVPASINSDAADDPAFWIHPDDRSKSIIYGSNKKGGIIAYDLTGTEITYSSVGNINNIDIAYNVKIKDGTIDICGGTNRSKNAIDIFRINPGTGELEFFLDSSPESAVDEVYGFCFYHSPATRINYAILCGKDGVIEHYEIIEGNDKLSLKLVSSFDIGGQPEGMVADHKHGILYIGEENKSIWKVNAEPGNHNKVKVAMSSQDDNENIDYDIEGLTIYYTSSDHGYLIASSQGNDSYAIYDRYYDNKYIGSFRIINGVVDETNDTDGIDVVNINLGPSFPDGIFIAQDGRNLENGNLKAQNFKVVNWKIISDIFEPPLLIDPDFNVRSLFED